MMEPPATLIELVVADERPVVAAWWNALPESAQRSLCELFDPRHDADFFGPVPEGEAVPEVSGGHFVPNDVERQHWRSTKDWLEYLIANPDVKLLTSMTRVWRRGWSLDGDEFADWRRTNIEKSEWPPSKQLPQRPPDPGKLNWL